MPDHETATPRDGGYRDRTGDLLLAKAQHTVHQGDANGTPSGSDPGSAAAAATRDRTTPESLRETRAGVSRGPRPSLITVDEYHHWTAERAAQVRRQHHELERIAPARRRRITAAGFPTALALLAHPGWNARAASASARHIYRVRKRTSRIMRDALRANSLIVDWDALERHARALDRSDAAHALRVRADQATGQQRHVRRAVGA